MFVLPVFPDENTTLLLRLTAFMCTAITVAEPLHVPSDGVVFPPNEEKASSVSLSLNLVNYSSALGPSQLELLI